jgi:transposase
MGTNGSGDGARRNRSWPEALKREIVAATLAPGASVSVIARQYDVNANQLFIWRRRFREEPCAQAVTPSAQLVPVMITAEPAAVAAQPSSVVEKIVIDVAGKYRVRVGGAIDALALRCVLDVLERR